MPNRYKALRDRQQHEVNEFPFFFAFNEDQFSRGMKSLGLSPGEEGKLYRLGSTGGFYRRTDSGKLHEMFSRHSAEHQAAINDDTTGDGYIYEMFSYELANHEYTYTNDISSTLDALGLTPEEINSDERLRRGLVKAISELREEDGRE